jgi:hypothetical protein
MVNPNNYVGRIDARDKYCPTCRVQVNCYCRTTSGARATHYHSERVRRSQRARRQLARLDRTSFESIDRLVNSRSERGGVDFWSW